MLTDAENSGENRFKQHRNIYNLIGLVDQLTSLIKRY